jgi:hypothetical protein
MAMRYAPQAGAAWRRKAGDGMVYVYFGPMDLKQHEDSWMVSRRLPLHFIKDSLQVCIAEKRLKQAPPTMNVDTPELYKALTESGLWILNMGGVDQAVEYEGATIPVPALSIVPPKAAAK